MYLPTRLPIFWEETRRRLRGGRGFAVLAGYCAALLLVLFGLSMLNPPTANNPDTWSQFGASLWNALFYGQLIVLLLIVPGLTASAISSERELHTLEQLFLTPMSSLSIIVGKFFGAIIQMLVVIVSGLPVVAVVFFYGGVSPMEMARGYFTILLVSLFFAALGFLASCLFARVAAAVAWAYGFMLIYCLGLPLLYLLLLLFAAPGLEGVSEYTVFLPLGPLYHLLAYFAPSMWNAAFWGGAASSGVEIAIILAGCILLMRRLHGASRAHFPLYGTKKIARKPAVIDGEHATSG